MGKVKECLRCGQQYDTNYCPTCGDRCNVRVDKNHICRHTQNKEKEK